MSTETKAIPKMDPGIKTRWVEALRSGKYKQGYSQLRSGSPMAARYCCLGVLCDISDVGTWNGDAYATPDGARADALLPFAVQVWAGIKTAELFHDPQTNLVARNDGCPVLMGHDAKKALTFKGIATWIEKNL